MSFYRCLELLNTLEIEPKEKKLVKRLKWTLLSRERQEHYEPFKKEIAAIKKLKHPSVVLQEVCKELLEMEEERNDAMLLLPEERERFARLDRCDTALEKIKIKSEIMLNRKIRYSEHPDYIKYQGPNYKLAELDQSDLRYHYRLGSDGGYCLGYTYFMADPTCSPYKTSNYTWDEAGNPPVIHLNKKIFDYQNHQDKPNTMIRCSRLTRRHFCSDIRRQAEEIYSYGLQYIDNELCLMLTKPMRKAHHAVYFCVTPSDIRYMDANHGVYLFKNKDEFLDFYCMIMECYFPLHYVVYEVCHIQYERNSRVTESKTLPGKFRTLLTGAKYDTDIDTILFILTSLFWSFTIAFIVTPYFFKGLSSNDINISVNSSFLICLISTLVPVAVLNLRALQHMYSGVLAIPHYLKDLWYCYLVVNNNTREQNNQVVAQHSSAKMVLESRLSCNESVSLVRSIRPNYGSLFYTNRDNHVVQLGTKPSFAP